MDRQRSRHIPWRVSLAEKLAARGVRRLPRQRIHGWLRQPIVLHVPRSVPAYRLCLRRRTYRVLVRQGIPVGWVQDMPWRNVRWKHSRTRLLYVCRMPRRCRRAEKVARSLQHVPRRIPRSCHKHHFRSSAQRRDGRFLHNVPLRRGSPEASGLGDSRERIEMRGVSRGSHAGSDRGTHRHPASC